MPHINIEINANYKYLIDDPTPALGRGSAAEAEGEAEASTMTTGKFSYEKHLACKCRKISLNQIKIKDKYFSNYSTSALIIFKDLRIIFQI